MSAVPPPLSGRPASSTHSRFDAALRHLGPGWFATVMGLAGLSLAWWRAVPLLGVSAVGVSLLAGALALIAFVTLAVLSVLRWQRMPEALADDLAHPVRHVFLAAAPIGLVLLSTVLTVLGAPVVLSAALWMIGSVALLGVTLWVLMRWLRPRPGGLQWASVTPAMLIPVVGNVVPPLAGIDLGYAEWAAAQMGIGLLLWPVLLALFAARLAIEGVWPLRILPTVFITVAPPSVLGLGLLQFGAPLMLVWTLWGVAAFFALWSASTVRRFMDQPFSIAFWGLSFPLAAFAALSLRLSNAAGATFQAFATALLALVSLIIMGLVRSTIRGLRRGELLVPEPTPPAPAASSATTTAR